VPSKSFRIDFFFKSKIHEEDTYLFFTQNKLHWHIYKLLHCFTVSAKTAENSSFWTFFNYKLWLLGSQQHPQSGVLLTSFSTWGTENSLLEINLKSKGVIKGCNIFCVQKLANTCSFVGGHIIVQQEKISRAECCWTNLMNALQEVIDYSFTKFSIYCFSLWYEFFVHYALGVKEKLSTWSSCRTYGISVSSAEGMSHHPVQNSVALFRGHRQNTRLHLL
jgi:hypothetical protein